MFDNEFYAFVVDTNAYAGNFEREMTAFSTGQYETRGEEEGEEYDEVFPDDEVFSEDEPGLISITPPCNDFADVCSIYPTPGWVNDGNGREYRLAEAPAGINHWPAYMSVAMFFEEVPTPAQVQRVRERAAIFAEREGFAIEGFRLVKVVTKSEEVPFPE